jgi:ferredoxin
VRYVVDPALCSGHGVCVASAAEVYSVDEAGFNVPSGVEVQVPAGLEDIAEAGADSCPEQAIRILS